MTHHVEDELGLRYWEVLDQSAKGYWQPAALYFLPTAHC